MRKLLLGRKCVTSAMRESKLNKSPRTRPASAGLLIVGLICGGVAFSQPRESLEQLVERAVKAYGEGRPAEAYALANQVIERDPGEASGYFVRGTVLEQRQRFDEALADYDRVVELSANLSFGYERRGALYFKMGRFEESIQNFDRAIELEPGLEKNHWQRGLSYYYAGRYQDGIDQFELSFKTVNPADYENGIWHFLCVARKESIEKARKSILAIRGDVRPGMEQIYDLYRGRGTVAEVMRAMESGYPNARELNNRLFYAHLYIGLLEDVSADTNSAREHIQRAVNNFPIPHYMWDIARIHLTTF